MEHTNTPDPQTLTEAVNLGKGYGIDTAETILALAIAKAVEQSHIEASYSIVLARLRAIFQEECTAYKSQLTKPVTEEEKRKFLNQQ